MRDSCNSALRFLTASQGTSAICSDLRIELTNCGESERRKGATNFWDIQQAWTSWLWVLASGCHETQTHEPSLTDRSTCDRNQPRPNVPLSPGKMEAIHLRAADLLSLTASTNLRIETRILCLCHPTKFSPSQTCSRFLVFTHKSGEYVSQHADIHLRGMFKISHDILLP